MTAVNPPYVAQGRTDHPAQLFRIAMAGLATGAIPVGNTAPAGGVNAYLGQALAVSGLASMNVQIGTGLVYIPNSTAWQGVYAGYNTATFNVAIPAASSTQWRSDYIVAEVTDPGDNTAAWNVVNVAGTFSSSAPGSLPALPANSVPLAIIRVVPNMTVTNGGGTVVDARLWQPLNGTIVTTSSARPSTSAPSGTTWIETDTGNFGVLISGVYNYFPLNTYISDTWHSFAPLTTGFNAASWGTTPTPGGNPFAKYKLSDDNCTHIVASINASASVVGTTWTKLNASVLASAYRPTSTQYFPITTDELASPFGTPNFNAAGGVGALDTAGQIWVYGTSSAAKWIFINAKVPLDL